MNPFWMEAALALSLAILTYYFIVLAVNLSVMGLSLDQLMRKMRVVTAQVDLAEESLVPVSILVPAFNEQATILDTVRALLRQDYPQFEIIVINDGSRDDTLAVLRQAYDLIPLAGSWSGDLACQPIRGVSIDRRDRRILVVDKQNGGKADALNAGILVARYPLVCCVDADGILNPDALKKLACHLARNASTVAVGGLVRPINGCQVHDGQVEAVHLPRRLTERIQLIEYLRAFLAGRFGWEKSNGLLIISGAFGMFRRQVLLDLGGYAHTIGEDMELTLRIHHALHDRGQPYRIVMAADAVCWTQVPDRLHDLRVQRIRWHKGLADALWRHRGMLLRPRYGAVGMAALPVFWLIELVGPLIELAGYLIFLLLALTGNLNGAAALLFAMAYLYGLVQSLTALVAEDRLSRLYLDRGSGLHLLAACLIEPLLYRPLLVVWRCTALFTLSRGANWGVIGRRKF